MARGEQLQNRAASQGVGSVDDSTGWAARGLVAGELFTLQFTWKPAKHFDWPKHRRRVDSLCALALVGASIGLYPYPPPHCSPPPHPSSRIATMSGAGENRYVALNECAVLRCAAPPSLTCPLAGGGQDQDRATTARPKAPQAPPPPPRTVDSSLRPHHPPMPGQQRASLLVQVSLRLRLLLQPLPSTMSPYAASTPTRSRTS
jgi:hypothetical protein